MDQSVHWLCCSRTGSERLWIAGLEKLRLGMSIIQIKRLWENIFVIGVYIFPKIDEKITSFYYLQDLLRCVHVHVGLKWLSHVLAFNNLYSYYLKMDVKRDVFCNESCLFLIHSIYLFSSQGSVSLAWHFEMIFCLFLNSTFAKWADECVLRRGNVQETLF